jgi:hypothetical protein
MDRRRFVPRADRLEGRDLLSLFGGSARLTNPGANLTIIKNVRIERLPGFLERLQIGRSIPPDVVAALQNDLRAIESRLHPPPSPVLGQFNDSLRSTIPHASLTSDNAAALDRDFGDVLSASGATPDVTAQFQSDMRDLARVDANGRNPGILAANDYALLAQMTQGIGTPIRTPAAPRLALADSLRPLASHTTSKTQPRLIGTYDAGTTIQIIDDAGTVLGSEVVPTTGRYVVTISTPLAPGSYTVRAKAVNPNGNVSLPSAPYTFSVVVPPQGPMARR